MSIAANIEEFKKLLPPGVELVAVSKFHPVEKIREAYNAGQREFGESRVQELLSKHLDLPSDIRWHFIGHLQTNKVKQLVGIPYLIESVDSLRLLEMIDIESGKKGIVSKVLMQVHVAEEDTKFGFYPDELLEFFKKGDHRNLKSTVICGIMGMATNTDDTAKVKNDFKRLHFIFQEISRQYGHELPYFTGLSMGMSGDWKIAVEEGANIVRIGSLIFGLRE